jgi:hypothetical protein
VLHRPGRFAGTGAGPRRGPGSPAEEAGAAGAAGVERPCGSGGLRPSRGIPAPSGRGPGSVPKDHQATLLISFHRPKRTVPVSSPWKPPQGVHLVGNAPRTGRWRRYRKIKSIRRARRPGGPWASRRRSSAPGSPPRRAAVNAARFQSLSWHRAGGVGRRHRCCMAVSVRVS